jgi:predicted transcriptional regulator of viral defense system
MDNRREAALARWLTGHHRVITIAEAQRLGIDARTLGRLAAAGRLTRLHPGVYAAPGKATAPPSWVTVAAAVLAVAGPLAALSHRSAAWLWQLLDQPPHPIDVVLPLGTTSRLTGARVHRSGLAYQPRSRDGLRLTDPGRTLVDLAGTTPKMLTGAVDRAVAAGLVRLTDLQAATQAVADHRRRGAAVLRAHLEWVGYLGAPTPSMLESLMTRIFLHYGLPPPRAEVIAGHDGEYRVDFAYPHLMLAIEVDGYVWHSRRDQVAYDKYRRNQLRVAGWTILEFTWRQVVDDAAGVAAQILQAYDRLAA